MQKNMKRHLTEKEAREKCLAVYTEKIVCMWDGKQKFDFFGMHHRRMIMETRWENRVKEIYQYPNPKSNERDEIKYDKR